MIGFGSGALTGKGFMQGTQSQLNFLPEKQTDFIFTMLAAELGLVGSLTLLSPSSLLLCYGFAIALRARNQFARPLALGLPSNQLSRETGRDSVRQYGKIPRAA